MEQGLAWVAKAPTQAVQEDETFLYGSGGLPMEWRLSATANLDVEVLVYDGQTYYAQTPEGWRSMDEEAASGSGLYEREILNWFWILSPLTQLRALVPSGPATEGPAPGTLMIEGAIDKQRLQAAVPLPLEGYTLLEGIRDWRAEVEMTAQGEIRRMAVTYQLESHVTHDWLWSRAEAGPIVPPGVIESDE